MRPISALILLMLLEGCRLTVGAGTSIGAANVGTSISVDPETGDVAKSAGASVTIR